VRLAAYQRPTQEYDRTDFFNNVHHPGKDQISSAVLGDGKPGQKLTQNAENDNSLSAFK
jgi:hypothetical protein